MSQTYQSIRAAKHPLLLTRPGSLQFSVIDMHTCGEPLRVILSGVPKLEGTSILQKRADLKNNYDHIRKLLMYEPRGHVDMYGCILVEPERIDSDFGIIFMHNEGYSTMCGHAIIAVTKLVAELGWKKPQAGKITLQIDAPCGLIKSEYNIDDPSDFAIGFEGVPSFVLLDAGEIDLDEVGKVTYDIAYGGAFYAYVDVDKIGIDLSPENIDQIIRVGKDLKRELIASGIEIHHPDARDLGFLYGVIFRSKLQADGADYRNVCVFADGEVDRSPTGSGVCGFLALMHHNELIYRDQKLVIESIISSKFQGYVLSEGTFSGYKSVVPYVSGNAFITGMHTFYLDPNDSLQEGFLLR